MSLHALLRRLSELKSPPRGDFAKRGTFQENIFTYLHNSLSLSPVLSFSL
jgi:hypothetical protein